MARQGKKNRPLACTNIEFPLSPKYEKTSGKFDTPIPVMRVINQEVIDEDDSEMKLDGFQQINLQRQVDMGYLTLEEVSSVMGIARKAWDNEVLIEEELASQSENISE